MKSDFDHPSGSDATSRDALERALGLKLAAIDEDFRRWVAAPPKER